MGDIYRLVLEVEGPPAATLGGLSPGFFDKRWPQQPPAAAVVHVGQPEPAGQRLVALPANCIARSRAAIPIWSVGLDLQR